MDYQAGVPQEITQDVPPGSRYVEVDLPCVGWPAGECVKVSIDWMNAPGCSATLSGGEPTDRRGRPLTSIKIAADLPVVGKTITDVVHAIVTIEPLQDFSSDVTITVV